MSRAANARLAALGQRRGWSTVRGFRVYRYEDGEDLVVKVEEEEERYHKEEVSVGAAEDVGEEEVARAEAGSGCSRHCTSGCTASSSSRPRSLRGLWR